MTKEGIMLPLGFQCVLGNGERHTKYDINSSLCFSENAINFTRNQLHVYAQTSDTHTIFFHMGLEDLFFLLF